MQVIVQVAGQPADPLAEPQASDDALDAQWLPLSSASSLPDIIPGVLNVVDAAQKRFRCAKPFATPSRMSKHHVLSRAQRIPDEQHNRIDRTEIG